MKKILIPLALITLLLITGCNSSVSSGEDNNDENHREETNGQDNNDEMKELTLEMAGQGSPRTLVELTSFIEETPELGTANDVSFHSFDIYEDFGEGTQLVFLIVNRLPFNLQDISFSLTMGDGTDEKKVWDQHHVVLSKKDIGILESNHAIPFGLALTEEMEETLRSINTGQFVIEIDDFQYESVE
ncbi:hypothetical protein HXA31_00405 [Salipaludibacillus agaradhaerens]|uniref:Lipoprotein n=1 Tax=Salipaludibacillus agaradhaerens TaxID=76935 RepID=A0A9Q4B466_SALAG|nr:hypothetical protein [Salipaludibacillus agaradhaerens]MCR6097692.1 hypothetical protein [Salipaludibacillus agaradhaerens]MCR6112824.1 hypothetical protein [Salipaludibacillus agaradhaerens]